MNVPLHLKQTFRPMILIFTESEGDGIESRLPYKNFSTLAEMAEGLKIWGGDYLCGGHSLPYLVEIGLSDNYWRYDIFVAMKNTET